jgi:Flp pilus assembly protein TadD
VAAGAGRADLLAYLAQAELERGRFSKAAAHARRAVALDPNLAEAYAYLGFAQSEAGRKREALTAYRQYLELAPRGRYAEDVRAIVRAGAGEH